MYFDQQPGAPHAIRWSKSFVSALKQLFSSFSFTNRKKKEKYRKVQFSLLVDQLLVVNLNLSVTPKHWWTPFHACFLLFFALSFLFFCLWWKKMEKLVLTPKKKDFDQWTACGAPVCWSNTQHPSMNYVML